MLTDTKIKSTKPGQKLVKLTDGGGLYLEVPPQAASTGANQGNRMNATVVDRAK